MQTLHAKPFPIFGRRATRGGVAVTSTSICGSGGPGFESNENSQYARPITTHVTQGKCHLDDTP
jgi:hypothetical protein